MAGNEPVWMTMERQAGEAHAAGIITGEEASRIAKAFAPNAVDRAMGRLALDKVLAWVHTRQ